MVRACKRLPNLLKVFAIQVLRAAAAAPFCDCLRFASGAEKFIPIEDGWTMSERPRSYFEACPGLVLSTSKSNRTSASLCTSHTSVSHFKNANMSLLRWCRYRNPRICELFAIQPSRLIPGQDGWRTGSFVRMKVQSQSEETARQSAPERNLRTRRSCSLPEQSSAHIPHADV
jgi:hypothetical protein